MNAKALATLLIDWIIGPPFDWLINEVSAAPPSPYLVKDMNVTQWIIEILLETNNPPSARSLIEASVHLSTRGKTYNAAFRDAMGKPVWKTTGLRDREQALELAQAWERAEKQKRVAGGNLANQKLIGLRLGRAPGFSEEEIAAILRVSVRTVREDTKRAFARLRRNPLLRQLWREWLGDEVQEAFEATGTDGRLSQQEIDAVLAMANTPLELRALRKLIRLASADPS